MFESLKNGMFGLMFFGAVCLSSGELCAAAVKPYKPKAYATKNNYAKKPCSKKAPYAGYGQQSKVNGLPKNKIISGHVKKTSKGYTYVNPYAKSK